MMIAKIVPFMIAVLLLLLTSNVGATDDSNCMTGSYRVATSQLLPVTDTCSGFKICPPGYFCSQGNRTPCPAGFFGNSSRLASSTCSGPCPAGYYCPIATAEPIACSNSNNYCPSGSLGPNLVSIGYYTDPSRSSQRICRPGSYCVDGASFLCPAGYYGATAGLSTISCSGVCPAGFYCPLGTSDYKRNSCGLSPQLFCPAGASRQQLVDSGYYASDSMATQGGGFGSQSPCLPGFFCQAGIAHPCTAGYYGANKLEVQPLCSGQCAAGHYCPPGSFSSRQSPCGNASVYCPVGSAAPVLASPGWYTVSAYIAETVSSVDRMSSQRECEAGSYCIAGVRHLCPAGTYGTATGLSSDKCSGYCTQGYYCPLGSTLATAVNCGEPRVICPLGSALPRAVQTGYYSIGTVFNGTNQYTEALCEPGYYCSGGIRSPCPAGTYGVSYGIDTPACSGPCAAGYYCPAGSSSDDEEVCGGADLYCPVGSGAPSVVSYGYVSTGGDFSTRSGQRLATVGSYALKGMENLCPGGTYGDSLGLTSPICNGPCAAGFYCPPGSSSAHMFKCGGDNFFCPQGSAAPIVVYEGYYTAYYDTEVCAPGFWRNSSAIVIDYSIPHPSTIAFPAEIAPCVPCANGTYKSFAGDSAAKCLPCPNRSKSSADWSTCECVGIPLRSEVNESVHFNILTGACEYLPIASVPLLTDDVWLDVQTNKFSRFQQFPCPIGSYCVDGVRRLCPGGHAGSLVRETRPLCSDICAAGYYCPLGSASPYQNICSDSSTYCPAGSAYPLLAPAGSFTASSSSSSTSSASTIVLCPPGTFCVSGIAYPCPAGTYSSTAGATACTGVCGAGFYCPSGSSSANQVACGAPSVYCPPGSPSPLPVHTGFYCDYGEIDYHKRTFVDPGRTECSLELPCEPGYYCSGGLKIPCPPGTFSWRYGTSAVQDCPLCAAGYYCPSTLEPQPGAPSFTMWPGIPQTIAANPGMECGGDDWYCPRGTAYPIYVSGGYYTYGGTNITRWAQAECELGWWCSGGVTQPCTNGRFGNTTGLKIKECSGLCPAGYYCPEGTGAPVPCPTNYYSVSGAWQCNPCPGLASLTVTIPCQSSRDCCFADELL